mgnify:CR=1 FL=1
MADINSILDSLLGPSSEDMDITAMKMNLDPKDPNIITEIAKKIDTTRATPLEEIRGEAGKAGTLGDAMKLQGQVKLLEQMQKHYSKRYPQPRTGK